MQVSILIVNWNGRQYIYDCLESIRQHVSVPFEVIVVDNASTDGSPDEIARRFPWVKLIHSDINLGYARANNLAASHATGKYLLLLNNDTALQSDITDAVRVLENDLAIGAVGAEMYGLDGALRTACAYFPTPLRLWRFSSMWQVPRAVWKRVDGVPVRRSDYVEGSFLLTPAVLWHSLNGMDERNFMYGDDFDYCRSLLNAGFATVQCLSVRYLHVGGYNHSRMEYLFVGYLRYHRKFSGPLTRAHAEFVLRTGLRLRLPWYRWRAWRGHEESRTALKYALQLHRRWKEIETDAFPHRSRKTMEIVLNAIESLVSRVKRRPFTLDRRIPPTVLLSILLRRCMWLMRGLIRTTLLQGRPAMVFMAPSVHLRNARLCTFGRGTTLETGVLIDGLSTDGIHLGENVTIGAYSQLRASSLSAIGKGLRFRNNSSCEAYSFIGAAAWIEIGENVIMGQHVSFHAENHVFSSVDIPIRSQGITRVGIVIEDDCWVGANVVFLDGCHVGRGCVIAAGAVVRGTIEPYSVIGGVPARLIRSRLQQETTGPLA